jgi:hypothetical protein
MWCGGVRSAMSVAAPFVWRCLTGSAITPFPYPAHRTHQADFPHCALGQDLTPSPTTVAGWGLHPLESAALSRRMWEADVGPHHSPQLAFLRPIAHS